MEPRFSLQETTPLSSKTELLVGGIKVYVYGLEEAQQQGYTDVVVLYFGHGRTSNYLVSEGVAQQVLHDYRSDGRPKKAGLISVTFDARNHGERKVYILDLSCSCRC